MRKLDEEWKATMKEWDTRLIAIGAALSSMAVAFPEVALGAWSMLPAELQTSLEDYKKIIAAVIFGSMLFVRLTVKKDKPDSGDAK